MTQHRRSCGGVTDTRAVGSPRQFMGVGAGCLHGALRAPALLLAPPLNQVSKTVRRPRYVTLN